MMLKYLPAALLLILAFPAHSRMKMPEARDEGTMAEVAKICALYEQVTQDGGPPDRIEMPVSLAAANDLRLPISATMNVPAAEGTLTLYADASAEFHAQDVTDTIEKACAARN